MAIKETTASLPVTVFYLTCVMPIPGETFQTSYVLGQFLAVNETVKQ